MTRASSAPPVPRTTSQRREHAQTQLRERHEVWLATGGTAGPHLIPVNYVWNGFHEFTNRTVMRDGVWVR